MFFWLTAGMLASGTLAALIWPFLGRSLADKQNRELITYYKKLKDAELEIERGTLTHKEAESLCAKITLHIDRLQNCCETTNVISKDFSGPKLDFAAIILVSAVLLTGSFGVYLNLGSPDNLDYAFTNPSLGSPTTSKNTKLKRLVFELAEKLKTHPDKFQDWILLGRTYIALERWPEAVSAFENVYRISPKSPGIASSYAESLYMAQGRKFSHQTKSILEYALNLDPRDVKSLFYSGLAKAMDNQYRDALQMWINLKAISSPNASWLKTLDLKIQKTAEAGGIDTASIKPTLLPPANSRINK